MSGGLIDKVYIGLDNAPAAFDIKSRILGPVSYSTFSTYNSSIFSSDWHCYNNKLILFPEWNKFRIYKIRNRSGCCIEK